MDHAVTYRFGPADYIALIRASRSSGPLGRLDRWGRAMLFGLLIVGLVIVFRHISAPDDSPPGDAWPGLVVDALVFVVVTLVAPIGEYLGERLMAVWLFPRYSVANKELTLALGDDGIRSKVGEIEGRISWRSIVRIIETKDYLFLAVSRAEMLVVPKRALPSAEAFADLARNVRTQVDASIAGR
jgi:hypothetical protein